MFVAEPQCDHAGVDAGVGEPHRGGVSQGVHRDVFAGQAWAIGRRGLEVNRESVGDRVGGHRRSGGAGEQCMPGFGRAFVEVGGEHVGERGGDRGDAALASFAAAGDVGGSRQL